MTEPTQGTPRCGALQRILPNSSRFPQPRPKKGPGRNHLDRRLKCFLLLLLFLFLLFVHALYSNTDRNSDWKKSFFATWLSRFLFPTSKKPSNRTLRADGFAANWSSFDRQSMPPELYRYWGGSLDFNFLKIPFIFPFYQPKVKHLLLGDLQHPRRATFLWGSQLVFTPQFDFRGSQVLRPPKPLRGVQESASAGTFHGSWAGYGMGRGPGQILSWDRSCLDVQPT